MVRFKGLSKFLMDDLKKYKELVGLDDLDDVIYHCTKVKNTDKILNSDVFKCSTTLSDKKPHICRTTKANYVVFTDSRIQFILDRVKLYNDFEYRHFDLYGDNYEGEIRYYSETIFIDNFLKYIKGMRISSSSLNSYDLEELTKFNIDLDKFVALCKGEMALNDLSFSELPLIMKIEKLNKENGIWVCDRMKSIINIMHEVYSNVNIVELESTPLKLFKELHTLGGVDKMFYEITWCGLKLFTDYDAKIIPVLSFFMGNYKSLVSDELLEIYNKYIKEL